MDQTAAFETLAEVGIALTGFTGIFVAIRWSASGIPEPDRQFRLRSLLFWSLGATFMALVPVALSLASQRVPWRACCLALAGLHASNLVWFFWSRRSLSASYRLPPPWQELLLFIAFVLLASLAGVVFGFFEPFAATLYFSGLAYYLFCAAVNFVVLLLDQDIQPAA